MGASAKDRTSNLVSLFGRGWVHFPPPRVTVLRPRVLSGNTRSEYRWAPFLACHVLKGLLFGPLADRVTVEATDTGHQQEIDGTFIGALLPHLSKAVQTPSSHARTASARLGWLTRGRNGRWSERPNLPPESGRSGAGVRAREHGLEFSPFSVPIQHADITAQRNVLYEV